MTDLHESACSEGHRCATQIALIASPPGSWTPGERAGEAPRFALPITGMWQPGGESGSRRRREVSLDGLPLGALDRAIAFERAPFVLQADD